MRRAPFALFASFIATPLLSSCSSIHEPSGGTPLFLIATIDDAVGPATQTSLAVGATGGIHVAYSQDGVSNLRYATCSVDCAQSASWATVVVDTTSNSGPFNSIVAGGGALRIVYQVYNGQGDLRYAECAANCLQTASWQIVTIDSAGNTGHDGSLAVGPAGELHVTYLESVPVAGGLWRLKYATCSASCTTAASWVSAVLDSAVFVDASSRALAVDGNARLHLVYQKTNSTGQTPLVYSTCATSCETPANWQVTVIDDDPFAKAAPVLALDASGAPNAGYWGKLSGSPTITYARCAGVCTTSIGWDILPIQALTSGTSDLDQHSLVIDAAGRPQMSFQHGGLAYAGCVTECTTPGAWVEFLVEPGLAGAGSSVTGLSGGGVGIVYLSSTGVAGQLNFAMSN